MISWPCLLPLILLETVKICTQNNGSVLLLARNDYMYIHVLMSVSNVYVL